MTSAPAAARTRSAVMNWVATISTPSGTAYRPSGRTMARTAHPALRRWSTTLRPMNPLAPVTATRPLIDRAIPCCELPPRLDWRREEGRTNPHELAGNVARDMVVDVPSVRARSLDRVRPRDAHRA